ncbi:hypothetical protein [Thiorhodococcus drewsii]|uniref:hypothetical protein n=1 Tax=Thiorhodococcus drewsii TaxID=210408 RepID=UPI001111AC93|nr:hypothetical protein [Thiorhodococcus drewsii]
MKSHNKANPADAPKARAADLHRYAQQMKSDELSWQTKNTNRLTITFGELSSGWLALYKERSKSYY